MDRLNAEGGTDSALWLLRGDSISYSYKMSHVKLCMTNQPVGKLSLQLARVAA